MRISFFTNNYKPFVGGVPIAIENLAGALRKRGHRVFIFAPEYKDAPEDELDVFRTWSVKNSKDSNFVFPLPLSLETYLNFSETGSEIVHCHHPFLLGETGLSAAKAADLPVVFTYHTQYEKYAHYMPWDTQMVTELAQNVATRFANCCDTVIAPSTDIKRTLLERGVTSAIEVIPTGVDLNRFRGGNQFWLRGRYAIPAGDRIVLFVSRLAREKNIGFLMDAFARMQDMRGNLRFVLVGSGDEEETLREQARNLGVEDRVIFTGTLMGKDLVSAYKGADLFMFASTTETQGMVVLEAMAGGSPVVAIEAPGVSDVVQHGRNGYLVEEGDLEGMVRQSLAVLENRQLHTNFRNGADERAKQMSLMNTTRQIEDVYRVVARAPHAERKERFVLLREIVRYQFRRLSNAVAALTI